MASSYLPQESNLIGYALNAKVKMPKMSKVPKMPKIAVSLCSSNF
jgi:hypothetical protein